MIDELVSHYQIVEQIGSGGMGVVYKAEDVRLHRFVALKFLPEELARDPLFVVRFQREARAASALSHPNICTIYDIGEDRGRAFIAMEYLAGSSLDQRITGCPMPIETVLSLSVDIASGLQAAHAKGIIHRDIKPANIFVVEGIHAKILDFGLAMLSPRHRREQAHGLKAFSDGQLTTPGSTVGTVAYMSPEQARGEQLDERTDVFSFGAVLYEMVTGKSPFQGDNRALIFDAILNQSPLPPISASPFLPAALEEIIFKALAKDRESRYQHVSEIRTDLRNVRSQYESQSIAASLNPQTTYQITLPATSAAVPALQPETPAMQTLDSPPSTIEIPAISAAIIEKTSRRKPFVIALALAVVLATAVVLYFWRTQKPAAPEFANQPSIAVLPFADLAASGEDDYFSDGLTEELINDLAKVPGIKVVGRSSAFQFKGKNEDLRSIGSKLGVANILEGTVRRDGNHLRVHADLISTKDGFQLWSDTYDRNIEDAFTVQEEIARATTRALKITLLRAGAETHSGISRPANPEAYEAYLQARYFSGRGQSKEDLEQALAFSDRAIKLDPQYAPAWAARSEILSTMGMAAVMDLTDAYQRARHDAERAIALDPQRADGYIVLARQQMADDRDWDGAKASLEKAAQLEPGSVQLLSERAQLLRILGRLDESIDLARQAAALDPLRARTVIFLGNLLYYAGRDEEADAALRKGLELNPHAAAAHTIRAKIFLSAGRFQDAFAEMELEPSDWYQETGLSMVYRALGRTKDSQSELEQLISTHKGDCAYQIAEVYADRGDADNTFEWLNRAYDQRDPGLRDLKIDPLLKPFRKDPRFKELLTKSHLA